jgi:hypothetical protein
MLTATFQDIGYRQRLLESLLERIGAPLIRSSLVVSKVLWLLT